MGDEELLRRFQYGSPQERENIEAEIRLRTATSLASLTSTLQENVRLTEQISAALLPMQDSLRALADAIGLMRTELADSEKKMRRLTRAYIGATCALVLFTALQAAALILQRLDC